MKKAALFFGIIFLLCSLTSTVLAEDINILLVMPNYYNTNYNLHEDNFEFMGWNITFAGVNETVRPCPNYAGPMGNPILTVDTLVSEITDVTKFDCIAIMSGSLSYGTSANDLVESADVLNLVKAAVDSGIPVAGFTSGVRVLAAAGVINGKNVTGDARYGAEYEAAGATFFPYSFPIVDGNIITSIGVFSIEATEALAALVEKTTEAAPRKNIKIASIRTTRVNPTSERVLWSKTFGGSAAEGGRKVLETSDGGFVFVGYTCSQGAGNTDVLLIKTDANGNEQWTKTYGSSGWEYAYGACLAPDGGVVVTGYSNSFSSGDRDAFLLKTDTEGNQQWFKTFGGDSSEVGRGVTNCIGGGYLICGTTQSYGSQNQDVYIVRTEANGDEMGYRVFTANLSEFGNAVIGTDDGGFIIAGSSMKSIIAGWADRDMYVLKIDVNGFEAWSKLYHHNYYDAAFDITKTNDGGYVITGDTDLEGADLMDIYTVKLDADGNEITNVKGGESKFYDYSRSIKATRDGGYIVCGTTKSVASGTDLYLVKTDSDGIVQWREILGDAGSDWGQCVYETSDGNYIVTGYTNSFGNGSFDLWVIYVSALEAQYNVDTISGHAPLEVNFIDKSQGKPTSWEWDFNNDGEIDSEEQNPTVVFDTPGYYSVKLTVQDGYRSQELLIEDMVRVFDGESALEFDGESALAYCTANESINFTDKLTMEAWVKPFSWGGYSFGNIFDKTSLSLVVNGDGPGFSLNSLVFIQTFSDGSFCYTNTTENSITLNTWQHIAVTFDGAANTTKIYINGIEQQVEYLYGTPGSSMADNSDIDLFVGCSIDLSMPFDGVIDEVRIWNIVRDSEQIPANMGKYLTGTENGLLCYWQMNTGSGDTIEDISGHDQVLVNEGALWAQGNNTLVSKIDNKQANETVLPDKFTVAQNYPNPFNPKTVIKYAIPAKENVTVKIYNVLGKEVATLFSGPQTAGYYQIEWDAMNYSSGVYFYRIQAGTNNELRKMLLVK